MADVDPGLAQRVRDSLFRELDDEVTTGVGAHFPELAFGRVLNRFLPPVRRDHRAMNVHARRETFVDERACELIGTIIIGHRRQHDREFRHSAVVLVHMVVVLFSNRGKGCERISTPDCDDDQASITQPTDRSCRVALHRLRDCRRWSRG